MKPDPLILAWQGRTLRVRHDDPHLGPYTPRGAVIRTAVGLAFDVAGLRLVLASTVGDRYRVRVCDDGSMVGLWRLGRDEKDPGPSEETWAGVHGRGRHVPRSVPRRNRGAQAVANP